MLNLFKSPRSIFIFILSVVFIIPGCGGGGGGDSGGGTPPPTVPTVINYSVAQPTIGTLPPLRGTADNGMQFLVTDIHLTGAYNRETKATTLLANNGMTFSLNASPAALGGGAMTIGLLTPAGSTALWKSGENPTAGQFQVNVGNGYPIGTILVIVDNTVPGGGTGVDIYVDGVLKSQLPWNAFTDTMTLTVDHQIIASLAYNVLQSVYRCLSAAYTITELALLHQDLLVQGGLQVDSTALTGFSPSRMTIGWGDANGNGDIDPGDNFLIRFTNWFVNNTGTSQYIYYGRVLWRDYWEGTNSSGTFVGGNFQFGVGGSTPEVFYEQEVDGGVPLAGSGITYQDSGILFLLSW